MKHRQDAPQNLESGHSLLAQACRNFTAPTMWKTERVALSGLLDAQRLWALTDTINDAEKGSTAQTKTTMTKSKLCSHTGSCKERLQLA